MGSRPKRISHFEGSMPLAAMQFTDVVSWSAFDFLLAGALHQIVAGRAVEHIGPGDFVVTTTHQAKFYLVLHVFNMKGAAAWT